MNRAAAALVLVFALAGCTTSQQLRLTRTQDATVHIETSVPDLCWSGAIGGATHDGCGNADIAVHDQTGMFSSSVQKRDATGAQITISIVVDGRQVASNETSADYGLASVIAPLP
jgi:hypothetical protein